MKRTLLCIPLAFLAARSDALSVDGTVCRMNRAIDRMIIRSDNGARVRVALGHSTPVLFESHNYDRADLRAGDRVHVDAVRDEESGLLARAMNLTMRVNDALVDSIFRSHKTVTGRFAVREAKTDYFSMRLPRQRYVRVDGKSAYGPEGRVRVGSLKPGDLLEVRGTWPSKDLLQATSISVITDYEPSFCTTSARRGEIEAETAAREADEQRFLNKSDH